MSLSILRRRISAWVWIGAGLLAAIPVSVPSYAQSSAPSNLPPRITAAITDARRAQLPGSLPRLAQAQFDAGRMPAETPIRGISLVFGRTPAQEADLQALLAAQQNPASPLYHQWLDPDQFAARFGMADSDLDQVETWLRQQGFVLDSVARSRNLVRFSGTVAQVEAAFQTEMHYYNLAGERHFAPATALSLPAAIAATVLGVDNLNDFRPRPHLILRKNFTSGVTGNVFFAPGDITTAYDVKRMYSAGLNGAGEAIAVVGQSAVQLSDIANFQSAAGLGSAAPTLLLVPGTGTSTVFADGDEAESDLDLEWSGAIATGANIFFVYTGSSLNYGAFDAIEYAVDEKIAPIVSSSYGSCEPDLGGATIESTLEQAAAQGQTVIAAAGDDGSTDCYGTTGLSAAQQEALAVDYPASSAYVTGVGGTAIPLTNAAYLTAGGGYWATAGGADVVNSLLQYVPEAAWNDDSLAAEGCQPGNGTCLSAGGGGASALFSKPSWQAGVAGIPNDGKRDVPDLALYASPNYPGYLFCTSDDSAWGAGQVSSCSSGFRDSETEDLTAGGGTSFAAPIFAGMVALLSQKGNYSSGQGLINPTLYTLAANTATYAAAFHDITTGNNDCTAGSDYCAGTAGFSAGAGYDQVTGLGSLDLYLLAQAWPSSTTSLIGTTTTVSASNSAPALGATVNFTISVTSNTGSTIPTGSVSLSIDGGNPLPAIALASNGTATYSTSFTTSGTHQIVANYSGDSTHAASTGAASVTIPTTSSGTGSFTLSATNLSIPYAGSGASTITITPASGYTGTVNLTFSASNGAALENLCYGFTNTASDGDGYAAVNGTGAVVTQLDLDDNASDCDSAEIRSGTKRPMSGMKPATKSANLGGNAFPAAMALAAFLFAGLLGGFSRDYRTLACVLLLLAAGFTTIACGSGSNAGATADPFPGTYTITVTGQDSVNPAITASTQFSFTIQ